MVCNFGNIFRLSFEKKRKKVFIDGLVMILSFCLLHLAWHQYGLCTKWFLKAQWKFWSRKFIGYFYFIYLFLEWHIHFILSAFYCVLFNFTTSFIPICIEQGKTLCDNSHKHSSLFIPICIEEGEHCVITRTSILIWPLGYRFSWCLHLKHGPLVHQVQK